METATIPTQTPAPHPTPTVRPKLRMPHPAIAAAKQFRESLAQEGFNAQPSTPPVPEQVTQPVPSMEPAGQPAPVSPPPQPQPQPQPAQPPQYVHPTQMPLPDSYYTQPEDTREDYRTLSAERDQLRKDLEQTRKDLESMQASIAKYRSMEDDNFIDSYLAQEGDKLVSINQEDAKRLLAPMYKTLRQEMARRQEEADARLAELNTSVSQRFEDLRAKEEALRMEQTRAAVLKAHPNLAELQKTEAYQRIMLTPVGVNSNLLLGNIVANEFQRGNVDYVNQILDQVQKEVTAGQAPALDNIASVSGAGVASAPAAPTVTEELDLEKLEQMKIDVQTGRMSKKEFREAMRKYRGAGA